MKKYFVYILFFSLLFPSTFLFSQVNDSTAGDKTIVISPGEIETYKKDPAFDYSLKPKEPTWWEKIVMKVERFFYKILFKLLKFIFGGEKAKYILVRFIKILPYLSIAFFLYFIFRYLLGVDLMRWRGKKEYRIPQVYATEEERIIKEEDLDTLIKEAIQNEDYRLAIRYYYLSLLKNLSKKGLIEWKPEKTNHQYIKELSEIDFRELFGKLTWLYDYVWYGKYMPDKDDFEQMKREYSKFNEMIRANSN